MRDERNEREGRVSLQRPTTETVVETLRRQMRAAKRARRVRQLLFGATASGLLAWQIYAEPGWAGAGWWLALALFWKMLPADAGARRRYESVARLYRTGESRTIGILAIALRDGDADIRRTAEQALLSILPCVRPEDATFLTPGGWNALLLIPFGRHSARLQIALLQALEQIGDVRALPAVAHLRRHADPSVRAGADACLPFLQIRAREAGNRATLLRSGLPAAPDADLLRAATPDAASASQTQLLHPVCQKNV